MALHHRASKLALMPAGCAAATVSTSILLGRYTSSTTSKKLNQVASRQLNNIIIKNKKFATTFPRSAIQQRFKSTVSKEVESSINSSTAELTGSKSKAGGKGFVQWYEGHLNARPVTTKAITGSILWGIGDVVAQVVPTFFGEDTDADGKEIAKKEFRYDVPRTARAVIFGFAIHAPLSHVHFNFLEWMTIRGGFQGLSIPVFKTIMEQVRRNHNIRMICSTPKMYSTHLDSIIQLTHLFFSFS